MECYSRSADCPEGSIVWTMAGALRGTLGVSFRGIRHEIPATRDDGARIWRLLPGDTSPGKWRLPLHSADARFGC
jgi:hypothetical protein